MIISILTVVLLKKKDGTIMQKIGREIRELSAGIIAAECRGALYLLMTFASCLWMFWRNSKNWGALPRLPVWLDVQEQYVQFAGTAFFLLPLMLIMLFSHLVARSVKKRDELLKKKNDLVEETLKACSAWD
ncbi:hypothetical protein [Roseovarius sp. EL26]|uniref:hypothetical protein n=1 Tax=Roseovarius sp. EL26 TaxID=2126672 RepID=UPI0013C51A46|nr:hypothetical protein [Roseovarius sp. EL26]